MPSGHSFWTYWYIRWATDYRFDFTRFGECIAGLQNIDVVQDTRLQVLSTMPVSEEFQEITE